MSFSFVGQERDGRIVSQSSHATYQTDDHITVGFNNNSIYTLEVAVSYDTAFSTTAPQQAEYILCFRPRCEAGFWSIAAFPPNTKDAMILSDVLRVNTAWDRPAYKE